MIYLASFQWATHMVSCYGIYGNTTPLDSTAINPINPVTFHPLNALWPVKYKSPILYLCLEPELCISSPNSTRSQPNPFHPWINLCSLSRMKLLIHKSLSLITKTRIRGLDAFNGMDGISVWFVDWCAHACVAEQGREISILSQLRTGRCRSADRGLNCTNRMPRVGGSRNR